jgi:hypothetical protein
MNANVTLVFKRLDSEPTSHRLMRNISTPFSFVQIRDDSRVTAFPNENAGSRSRRRWSDDSE